MQPPEQVKDFPSVPGIYRMLNARGTILYIGKAKDLKKRVQSYWTRAAKDRYQVELLLKQVKDVDCIVTDTEKEALLLERTLIRKHKPKYNIELRDDKSYPSLKLSIQHDYPRIYYTRDIKSDGGLYYGPYSSAFACRQVVDYIERYFLLRTCSDRELKSRKRPCIQYQIGRCSAPCVDYISKAAYQEIVAQIKLLLEGRSDKLRGLMEAKMAEASDEQRYEEAARYRDLLRDLDKTMEQQKMVSHQGEERDFVGLYREGESGMIAVLMIRAGKVSDTHWFPFKKLVEDEDVIESFLTQYYSEHRYIPPEVYVQLDLPGRAALMEYLSDEAGRKVRLFCPKKGDKRDLLSLAMRNAGEAFKRRSDRAKDREAALEYLQQRLGLEKLPRRMECFDISNIQGKQPVGSMVRFKDGEPDKSYYRRFKIKTLPEEPNDYAMMYEVLSRRFRKAVSSETTRDGWREETLAPTVKSQGKVSDSDRTRPETNKWILPDLIVIDGGKGQLNIAKKVLEELDILNVDLCSLAKPQEGEDRDKVFIPGRSNPILLPKNSSSLHLLMRLRDEAHRFAITFHKQLRGKQLQASELDKIPGIGDAKKKALLKHFGSLKRVKLASVAQLAEVKGVTRELAEQVHRTLKQG